MRSVPQVSAQIYGPGIYKKGTESKSEQIITGLYNLEYTLRKGV